MNEEPGRIKFADGYEACIDACYVSRTYLGFLEGRPQLGFNQARLKSAKTDLDSIWGRRRTHVVTPETTWSDEEHEWLPPWQIHVWLTCAKPINLEYGQSELVIVFFRDTIANVSLSKVIQEEARSIRWAEHAKDFESD